VSRNRASKRKYTQNQVEEAFAGLIASTRRVRRKLNLLEIARKLRIAREAMGSLKQISDAVGVSEEMLRQFSRVEKLSQDVKDLLANGIIQSVDIADRLSRLPMQDQFAVAQEVAKGDLNSADIRAIVSLRKALPRLRIENIIDRVKASRNIKEYVVQFLVPPERGKPNKDIESQFIGLLGKENLRSFRIKKGVGTIFLNATGKNRLQEIAKKEGLTKRKLVNRIVFGEVK
jgi:hypothetical protein